MPEINPHDAAVRKLSNGQRIVVKNDLGEVHVSLKVPTKSARVWLHCRENGGVCLYRQAQLPFCWLILPVLRVANQPITIHSSIWKTLLDRTASDKGAPLEVELRVY